MYSYFDNAITQVEMDGPFSLIFTPPECHNEPTIFRHFTQLNCETSLQVLRCLNIRACISRLPNLDMHAPYWCHKSTLPSRIRCEPPTIRSLQSHESNMTRRSHQKDLHMPIFHHKEVTRDSVQRPHDNSETEAAAVAWVYFWNVE